MGADVLVLDHYGSANSPAGRLTVATVNEHLKNVMDVTLHPSDDRLGAPLYATRELTTPGYSTDSPDWFYWRASADNWN
jgi:hypothetical protein